MSSAYYVLPSEWLFEIGDTLVPVDPNEEQAPVVVLGRVSDAYGSPCYWLQLDGGEDWSFKTITERYYKLSVKGPGTGDPNDPDFNP